VLGSSGGGGRGRGRGRGMGVAMMRQCVERVGYRVARVEGKLIKTTFCAIYFHLK
jgi:hypothetical protein